MTGMLTAKGLDIMIVVLLALNYYQLVPLRQAAHLTGRPLIHLKGLWLDIGHG